MKTTLIPKIVKLSFQITGKSQWTSKIILLGGKSLKKRKISTIIQKSSEKGKYKMTWFGESNSDKLSCSVLKTFKVYENGKK